MGPKAASLSHHLIIFAKNMLCIVGLTRRIQVLVAVSLSWGRSLKAAPHLFFQGSGLSVDI
jgi:hypothetical protein